MTYPEVEKKVHTMMGEMGIDRYAFICEAPHINERWLVHSGSSAWTSGAFLLTIEDFKENTRVQSRLDSDP